ncbi:MAG TPA: tetratricopeptide repeat protein [Pyrinomonadaceae bacterium]|nr:tetratricopeptide repeat protein [Pyrinomonadaceae bacterium]
MSDENRLHILAICSRPLIDTSGDPIPLLDVTEERRRIETSIKRAGDVARVHFLSEATTGEVKAALREEWDVVHFTGHGTDDGRLKLEDGFGGAHLLTKQETTQLFNGQRTPLVVLSACYSEIVGQALHAAGVPAVIAVDARVPIADLAAIIFAQHFYAALARGWDVQRAFADAQGAVALDAKVGDAKPPQDASGNDEESWSQRFKLIGAVQSVVAASTGAHRDAPVRPRFAGNLPEPSANYVGRAKEIVDVVKAFDEDEAPRVGLWGSGGLGKTELAKVVARWYVERERVDALLWASASHVEGEYKLRDLASLLSIAARVFRLPITEQSRFDEQKDVVREFLVANRALVLLDNWETIESKHRRELWDFALSLPEPVRVLVTSRDVLPPQDARNLELDTLAPADAAALFTKIERNTGYAKSNPHLSDEEGAILCAICERLSGYPLAIAVVAGQTVSRTRSEIWADLQRVPKDVLEGKHELTGEPRGVWTSLGLSYDVLSADEQMLFRQMCVFLAPAAVEDITAITTVENARPVLDTLVKRSLVRMREGAYALLPMVRLYAESKLADAGENPRELHRRAGQHYEQKGTMEGTLTASDHIFELATRFEVRFAADAFTGYVANFYRDLVMRGYWAEARSKTEQLITVARALGDKPAEARAIGTLGIRYQNIGEYERADELSRQAQSLFEESDDKSGVAAMLHQLGNRQCLQGNNDEATRLYQQSLQIVEELGEKDGIARTLHQLGMMAEERDDYDEALRLYQESLKLTEELGDKKGIAGTLGQLGKIAGKRKDFVGATQLFEQSLKIDEELGYKLGIATTLHQLGSLACQQKDYDQATRLCRQSLQITEELGSKKGSADALGLLGIIAEELGKYSEATELFQKCLEIREELGEKLQVAAILQQLAMVARKGENYTEATRLYLQSLQITEEGGYKKGSADTLGQLGQFYRERGQMKDALSCSLRALAICEELDLPNRRLALNDIVSIQDEVDAVQFTAWLGELSTEAERISGLLTEHRVNEFFEQLGGTAQGVVAARVQGSAEQQAALAQHLAEVETTTRERGTTEPGDFNTNLANFYAVLRGLLAGEDMTDKIAALDESFKEIVERARAASA